MSVARGVSCWTWRWSRARWLTVSEFYRVLACSCLSGGGVALTVHDHGDLLAVLFSEDIVQQRGLAGSEVALTRG